MEKCNSHFWHMPFFIIKKLCIFKKVLGMVECIKSSLESFSFTLSNVFTQPLCTTDVTQGQFFKQRKAGLNL